MSNTLTCVYCGMAYPEGTPPHSSKVLTNHIKVCEKHPMAKLRKALADMVGASTKEELEQMEPAGQADAKGRAAYPNRYNPNNPKGLKMKNYLSMGFGVNSIAMHLMLIDQGVDFESVFVHHGADWPETYNYAAMFQWWLKKSGYKPVTILIPEYKGYTNLYDYAFNESRLPARFPRWCTGKFKVRPIEKYYQKPCFQFIGIDAGEAHRAKLHTSKSIENRWPLIENGIDREGCKKIIRDHGLPVPPKSGCYICPFQSKAQWVRLRYQQPCLFQSAVDLENHNNKIRNKGKKPYWLSKYEIPLESVINVKQNVLFEQDEYPPCQCGL